MRPFPALFAALAALLFAACSPEIKSGHFTCSQESECPDEWYCWSTGRCYDTPEVSGGDGSLPTGDARPGDAVVGDARVDTGIRGDGAVPSDDAGPDAGCVTNVGELCGLTGRCGARISCTGECTGGSTEPACACSPSSCQADGTWSPCTGPPNFGNPCSSDDVCGGTIDCMGVCADSAPRPTCGCGTPTCDAAAGWTCPDPTNFGQRCDTAMTCNGSIDCNGDCSGGGPLPQCECGTPTCAGCMGGTCGVSSQCTNGTCTCTQNDCSCPSPNDLNCGLCLANGNLGSCSVDAYGCGVEGASQSLCDFGCTAGPPPVCACSPDAGRSCSAQACSCPCGTFDNDGVTHCDGSCTPFFPNCGQLCFDICGPFCPFPPCPDPN